VASLFSFSMASSFFWAESAAQNPLKIPSQSSPQSAGKPDSLGIDRSVQAGDDFFAFTNGAWLKNTQIPQDKPAWGTFWELDEEATKKTQGLLADLVTTAPPVGSAARLVADFYASFMDEAAIEARGRTPLAPLLGRLAALKDRRALARVLGEELRADVDPLNSTNFHTTHLFGLWVGPNLNAPQRHAPYLLQGGLGLPDREYYLSDDAKMAELRQKYQTHIAAMLQLAGLSDAKARAARILALETKLARAHASRQESSDVRKANNPWSRVEFARHAPGLDWDAFFRAAGLSGTAQLIVWHPQATAGIAQVVSREPLQSWQDWLMFHTISRSAPLLPKAFVDENFAFFEATLAGTPQLAVRWKRAVAITNHALGDAVGKLYVQKHFSPQSKAMVQQMVQNIRGAFAERIDKLSWMAPETKAKAKEKLATLYVGVGYPERFIDYTGLRILPGDVIGNVERAERFEYQRCVAKLAQPVDVSEWAMSPQTVNAINLPLQNALNFPAAVLAPPFFDPAATPAANYGAIGAIIGHEISHSFDDQGAQFDAQGKLVDWWTKEDRRHFEAAGEKLAAQYDAYEPLPNLHVNGKLTLSENIADLAGLAATHDAWRKTEAQQPAPTVQGFNGEQQFFLSYNRSWRGKSREEALRQQLITDGHAPERYRAGTVRNLDAWYPAFDVRPGQKLFLAPKDRVQVW
jgi:putative endopeptidase